MFRPARFLQGFFILHVCSFACVAQSEGSSLDLTYSSGIRSILEDSTGRVWIGSHSEGLAMIESGTVTYFDESSGLSDLQIRSIQEGADGTLWFEGARGLTRYDGWRMSTVTERHYSAPESLAVTKQDLWFKGDAPLGHTVAERGPGAYQYDGQTIAYRAFPIVVGAEEENYYSITTPVVYGRNDTLWFGTYGAAIGYNSEGFDIIDNRRLELTESTGLLHIRSLFEDSQGTLWIGNNGIGVFRRDHLGISHFSEQLKLDGKAIRGELDRVFSIGEDRWGNLWFGTVEFGAYRYSGQSLTQFSKTQGLASDHIWTIYTSPTGELWVGGANPSGVYRFTGKGFERLY